MTMMILLSNLKGTKSPCQSYYVQADLGKPEFADCILETYAQKGSTWIPEHLCCCMKEHEDGSKHYHLTASNLMCQSDGKLSSTM